MSSLPQTTGLSTFTSIAKSLGSRLVPESVGNKVRSDFEALLKQIVSTDLPEQYVERLAARFHDWSFAVPIHKDSKFFGIACRTTYAKETMTSLMGDMVAPSLKHEESTLYFFEHPPYPLTRLPKPPYGFRVIADNEYIVVPGPDMLVRKEHWLVSPTDVPVTELPVSLWHLVSPVQWDRVRAERTLLPQFLSHFCAKDFYGTVPQRFLFDRYIKAAAKKHEQAFTYHEFEQALSAYGIQSHAPGGGSRYFRGLRCL